ncbi:hypothetical protein F0562_029989 [Nyssa sinensis]|uniref:E2 ubiquitin-conjugating enzyme n=1 Tax=Nyssa sinensis TaxID=561372 RepID=A0A5J5AYS8_9ASTE|nr:hypothetical protein F0562_029989 [Nyssa sinensis]
MAQAARLSLRMQKEFKLLLTDPPPGASFPALSSDTDLSSSSLSSIDAQIEGPEGTVYAKGIFKIKIQIPERYPFQPPIVTFATPIYHPNIDNGGRICLDILNLPPKGAWQPSLNISTVLTSIGLLLSEPNPDDGLMCEASREYKYNRQTFDQKARSMTEKYARAGSNGNDSCSQSKMEPKGPDVLQCEVNERFVSHKKLRGISQKLSLESSVSNQEKGSDRVVNKVPIHHSFENQMEVKGPKEDSKEMFNEYYHDYEKPHGTRRKLSLESLVPSQMRGGDNKENMVPNCPPFFSNLQSISMVSSDSLSVLQASNHCPQWPHQDRDSKSIKDSINTSPKKLSPESLSSGQISDDNDGVLHKVPQPLPSESCSNVSHGALPMPQAINNSELGAQKDATNRIGSGFTNTEHKKLGLSSKKLSLGLSGSSKSQEKGNNKENVAPIQNFPFSHLTSLSMSSSMSSLMSQVGECCERKTGNCATNGAHKKLCGISRKLPLEPLGQYQGSNDGVLLHLQSENLTAAPSKSLPVPHDCRCDEKQLQKQDHAEKFARGIEQQREGSPASETVIVLDS